MEKRLIAFERDVMPNVVNENQEQETVVVVVELPPGNPIPCLLLPTVSLDIELEIFHDIVFCHFQQYAVLTFSYLSFYPFMYTK